MTDPYETLGLSRDASPNDIRQAYRRRAKTLHPDGQGLRSSAEFILLTAAKDLLLDPERRRRYDETGQTTTDAVSDPAMTHLQTAFQLILQQMQQKDVDIDPTQALRELIGHRLGQVEDEQRQAQRQAEKLEQLAKRIRRKSKGKPNMLGMMTEGAAKQHRQRQQQLKEEIPSLRAALEMAKDFSFDPAEDTTQNAVYMMYLNSGGLK